MASGWMQKRVAKSLSLVCPYYFLSRTLPTFPRRVDPATAEEIGQVPEMGLAETKEAIEAASKAFKTWSKTTAKVCLSTRLRIFQSDRSAFVHSNVMIYS